MSKRIVTHDSSFHTDDIFAVATLTLLLGDVEVVRSREQAVIDSGDYVVDTGLVLDPSKHRYDHHQPEGAGKRDNGIPYASFGLVWKEFGPRLAGGDRQAAYVDTRLAQPIDAFDNGVAINTNLYEGIRWYDIGDFLMSYLTKDDNTPEKLYERFMQLVQIAKELLEREMRKAQDYVDWEDKLMSLYEGSQDKRLIEIPDEESPWRVVFGRLPEPVYIIYQRRDRAWGVKAVPDLSKPYGFTRKQLPEAWGGRQGEELQRITGVEDAVFAHRGLFMVVAKSREGALKLAQMALNA